MINEKMTENISAICEKLLSDKKVDLIIAYRGGGINDMQIPYFAKQPSDVQNIEWGDRCYQNIAPYLYSAKKKAGILAKPCDVRVIVQYITEQQLTRENVYIIGVDCVGMVDENGKVRPGCTDCTMRKPPIYDEYVKDEKIDGLKIEKLKTENDNLAENFERFQNEIKKCILCYACRQACYGCYCKTCFIERDLPDWQPAGIDTETKMMFHMGRAMHLAGRCVECGACEASCQSGVNVRYIIKNVTRFIEELYDYSAGIDADKKPALLVNKFDDEEVGFLRGADHG
jgi:coenzyme F420-reducing hydrogenase beta subunit